MDLILILCYIWLLCWVVPLWCLHLLALWMSMFYIHKESRRDAEESYPPVTIIKPLSGDGQPHSNIDSFFNIQYSKYEIIFCIQSEDDTLIEVVQKLIASHPEVDASIFRGHLKENGPNPKINNMLPGYNNAKYDHIWMIDSGIMVFPNTLFEMMAKFQSEPNIGLVHQIPYWVAKPDFGSCLNQIYFGTHHARIYLSMAFLGVTCASGMSFLTKKSIIEETGGLQHYSQYLAEDYFLTVDLQRLGYKLRLCSVPALQNRHGSSVKGFITRIHRWSRLRAFMIPHTCVLEPLVECFLSGLLTSLSLHYIIGLPFYIFYFSYVIIWISSDCLLIRKMENGQLLHLVNLIATWWVRETLSIPIILHALSSSVVVWNNQPYRLKLGGHCEKINQRKPVISV